MKTYGYGHDFGNSETCGVMFKDGKTLSNTIPSVTSQGSYDDLGKLGIQMKRNTFVYAINGSDTEHYVGDVAFEQGASMYVTRGDISRYWSNTSLALLLTTAASLTDETEFGINVVTGLPVQTYMGDPSSRKLIKEALEGKHTFMVNRKVRTIHVKVSKVIMEGAGAAIAYGSSEDRVQGVIDIGGRTTDLYAAQGQTPQRKLCKGKPLGVEAAGDLLSENFKKKYKRELSAIEIRQILRAAIDKGTYPIITARQRDIMDIPALATDALKQIGNEIASFVSSSWNNTEAGLEIASSFSSILCIGGGAYYFYDRLTSLIENLTFIEKPEQANAYGYAVFAEQQRLSLSAAS